MTKVWSVTEAFIYRRFYTDFFIPAFLYRLFYTGFFIPAFLYTGLFFCRLFYTDYFIPAIFIPPFLYRLFYTAFFIRLFLPTFFYRLFYTGYFYTGFVYIPTFFYTGLFFYRLFYTDFFIPAFLYRLFYTDFFIPAIFIPVLFTYQLFFIPVYFSTDFFCRHPFTPDYFLYRLYFYTVTENERILLTRYRTGSHSLDVELGRFSNIPRQNRLCTCGVSVQTVLHIFTECQLTRAVIHHRYTSLSEIFDDPNLPKLLISITKLLRIST